MAETLFEQGQTMIGHPVFTREDESEGRIDGVPEWESTGANFTINVLENGDAEVTCTGPGTAQIKCTGDGNLKPGDENKRPVVLLGDVAMIEPEVFGGRIEFAPKP